MQQTAQKKPPKLFKKGDKIEVRMQNDAAIWYPATFLHSSHHQVYVKLETSSETDDPTSPLRRAYVSADDVRPAQPPELHRYLKVGEMVEGFCRERRGWVKAEVVEILENSRCTVSFEGEGSAAEMEQWELRAIREWVDGFWDPPFLLQELSQSNSTKTHVRSTGLRLKIKCSGIRAVMKFSEGMLVEVKTDKEDFLGSWLPAVIVKSLRNDKFLVEYRSLRTKDRTELLKEEVGVSCIKHCPPFIQRVKPYEYLERVDAWYNGGWWEGYIGQVFNSCSYMVRFIYSNEEMVFEHFKLRPHQEWIDGEWLADFKVNPTDLNLKSNKLNLKRKHCQKASEPTFKEGMMVEVKSDEEGFQGSWYTAVIVCSLSCDKFLIEYQTLKTDDESELLKEEAFAAHIRPCSPKIDRIDCYKMLEQVDAWYNDGWWVGIISKVFDDRKYAVYFWTTNEDLVFEHFSLRPHQEWIDGKWSAASGKKPKLLVKNKQGNYKGENDGIGVETNLLVGTKVEVKCDQIYGVSWYPAVVLKSLGRSRYLVEYKALKTDDGMQLHKEEAHPLCMRPCPPVLQRTNPFKPFEVVDAWYNGGWCVGQICKAFPGRPYSVFFDTMNETLKFQHSDLRPHQEWINGQWVFAIRGTKLKR